MFRAFIFATFGGNPGAAKGRTPKGNIPYKTSVPINSLLLSTITLESVMIRRLSFPFGHSLVCAPTKEMVQ